MNDQYYPLNITIIGALSDKVADKRKTAAAQIEGTIRELDASGDGVQIKKAILIITNLIQSSNANNLKGGFIGLTAIGLGLRTETIQPYFMDLVKPLFPGFKSSSPTVRFYATEGLYNMCKVAQVSALTLFNEMFMVMVDLANDTDDTVKMAADLLNQVLKDIIMLSNTFNIHSFIPVLRERLLVQETASQGTVVSWVETLLKVSGVNLIPYLPTLLDGFFILLASHNVSVKKSTEIIFGELLCHIDMHPEIVDYKTMISTLSLHAHSQDPKVQYVALLWSSRFVEISGRSMLPFIPGIVASAIPCYAFEDEEHAACKLLANNLGSLLNDLITPEDDGPIGDEESGPIDIEDDAVVVGDDSQLKKTYKVDVAGIVDVLMEQLQNTPVPCQAAALRWVYQLNIKLPLRMHWFNKKLFDVLMNTVTHPSDAVVLLGLQVIAQISSMPAPSVDGKVKKEEFGNTDYYNKFMSTLLNVFYMDNKLLTERGPYIIRELCVLIPAENIFKSLGMLMQANSSFRTDFICEMVNLMSLILLTAKELFSVRLKMRHLDCPENYELFVCLYNTWCHCPVSALTLCLLAERYEQAEIIVKAIAQLDINVGILMDLDKLVQLLESPIFTFLRLKLVSQEEYPALVKTLYGILMLLPQTDAFQKLSVRMTCMPRYPLSRLEASNKPNITAEDVKLIEHFESIQKGKQHSEVKETRKKLENVMKL